MTRRSPEHLNHELRSPMTVVVGLTDLMLLAPANAEQQQFLQSVRQAADALLRILDEAVDFSRLEVGGLELNDAEFSVAEVVAQARETLAQASAAIELAVAVDESVPPRLVGDADRWRQVIVALARSAAKFRAGRVFQLRIAAEPALAGKAVLHLALGDAGRPFDALEATPTGGECVSPAHFAQHGYAGPGMALPVVAGLAQLMGGRLWIAQQADSPVLFRLDAQFRLPDERRLPDLLAAVEERFAVGKATTALRLLLVEDTPANCRFFTTVLEQRGHTVVSVSNGHEALQMFSLQAADAPFDLALIDLEMPVMNGWQTAAALRQLDLFRLRPVPLVALTAHSTEGDGGPGRSPLFDAAIGKPCELDRLYRVVESLAAGVPTDKQNVAADATGDERVDYHGTLRRLGGNQALFYDLVRFCLEDAPGVLAELAGVLDRNEPAGVERAAHSLKGLVANFGAKQATLLSADLQRLGHEGDLSGAAQIYEQLQAEVDLLRRDLEAYQAKLSV